MQTLRPVRSTADRRQASSHRSALTVIEAYMNNALNQLQPYPFEKLRALLGSVTPNPD